MSHVMVYPTCSHGSATSHLNLGTTVVCLEVKDAWIRHREGWSEAYRDAVGGRVYDFQPTSQAPQLASNPSKKAAMEWIENRQQFFHDHGWRPRLRRRCRFVFDGCPCVLPRNPPEWKAAAAFYPGIRIWSDPRKDSPCSCSEGDGWVQLCTSFKSYLTKEPQTIPFPSLPWPPPLDIARSFTQRALAYLRLMHAVDRTELLGNPFFLELALCRCREFFQLEDKEGVFVPPLDVMCVWAALMIRNYEFMEMCADYGLLIHHQELRVCSSDGQIVCGSATAGQIELTKAAYSGKFKKDLRYDLRELAREELPFLAALPNALWTLIYDYTKTPNPPLPLVRDDTIEEERAVAPMPRDALKLTEYITVFDILQDRGWWPLLLRSLGKSSPSKEFPLVASDIEPALAGYHRFLFFASALHHNGASVDLDRFVAIQQDVFWHTHLIHPATYEKDCLTVVGVMLYHTPWPDSIGEEDRASFEKVWAEWKALPQ